MDHHTKANWLKIKRALEQAGKTDCFFYRRALAITSGFPDPLDTSPGLHPEFLDFDSP